MEEVRKQTIAAINAMLEDMDLEELIYWKHFIAEIRKWDADPVGLKEQTE